jgi:hypothetical protein
MRVEVCFKHIRCYYRALGIDNLRGCIGFLGDLEDGEVFSCRFSVRKVQHGRVVVEGELYLEK